MAKSFTLYKLIILYMLNQVDFPLLIPRYLNSFWIKDIQPTSNYSRLYPNFWNRDLSEKSLHITVHFTILRKMVPRQSTISPTISHLRSSMILMNF